MGGPPDRSEWQGAERALGDGFLFVFAVIGDSHVALTWEDSHEFLQALTISSELLANCVADINAHVPPVDFAIQLGDLTHTGRPEQFEEARSILDELACPLYPVVGNHDNMQSDNKQGWKTFAGMDSTIYSFDHQGYHFVVTDCTLDPYKPPRVRCGKGLRDWVAADLRAHRETPAIVLSHYNMWERGWNARFDTTGRYGEYKGMPELRQVLEQAGNVLAVINGHVHANRVEVHSGIYYIDVGATLVGRPSIRYFYVYPDSMAVAYEYISDKNLFDHVVSLCPQCTECFNALAVCDFIDGSPSDKRFTIPNRCSAGGRVGRDTQTRVEFSLKRDRRGSTDATIISDAVGPVEIILYDASGIGLGQCVFEKNTYEIVVDLNRHLPLIEYLKAGTYYVRVRHGGQSLIRELVLPAGDRL
jgi:predicted phosphodiesterase